jgi:hypothetical protein
MDLGFGTDFVPDRFQSHPNDRVEVFELGIPDVDILQVEVLNYQPCNLGFPNPLD